MISKTESRILELLFDDFTRSHSILELSKILKVPYAQAYKATNSLLKKELVKCTKGGKANFISIELKEVKKEYIMAELSRRDCYLKDYPQLKNIYKDLENINKLQFICIVFGSYAKRLAKKNSDIDLLFIIPKDYDYDIFERNVKNAIVSGNVDMNIVLDESLHEMWGNPSKLNIANELLKGHLILKGAEQFLEALKRHNVG